MYQTIFTDNFIIRQSQNLKSEESKTYVDAYLGDKFIDENLPQNSTISININPIPNKLGSMMVDAHINDPKTDFYTGKILYEALRFLTPREASNPGFWSYLHHFQLFSYLKLRWPDLENPPNKSTSESYILNHWLQSKSSQGDLMDYPLSGLWWAFYISEEREKQNPYELTEILFKNFSFRTKNFGQSKVFRHKEAVIGVLEFIKENDIHQNHFEINGQAITTYVNLLGGIKPLSYFDRQWFKTQLEDRFPELIKKNKKVLIGSTTLIDNPLGGFPHRKTGKPEEQVQPVLKNGSTQPSSQDNILCYLWLYKDGKYSLNSYPTGDVQFCIPIYKKFKNGFLLQLYDNGKVNKVPLSFLLTKTLDPKVPLLGGLNWDANLLEIKCIPEDCLLWVTAMDGRKGKAGKIFRTSWLTEKRTLEDIGTAISNITTNLNYATLPENLDRQVSRLIQRGSSSFCHKNNKFYKTEWEFIKNYFKEIIDAGNGDFEPVVTIVKEPVSKSYEIGKYLNIYETGLFYFSQTPSGERLVKSILIPTETRNKHLFFCYDNGQVTKFPLEKLPDLNFGERVRNGKYARAGLVYIQIGESNANILLSRFQRQFGNCYKIHDCDWLPERDNMHDKGTEVVSTLTRLKYVLLPPELDPRLKNLKGRESNKRVLLDHHSNKVQKNLLYNLVPDFFEE